jgi:hypothetical protein
VLELAAAELRVDRDERHAGGDRGHGGDARLERRLRPHRDALRAVESRGERRRGLAQLAVGEATIADRDGGLPVELVHPPQQLPAHEHGG